MQKTDASRSLGSLIGFPLSKYKKEMLTTLAKLISIPSVKEEAKSNMPYGRSVFNALMYMLDTAERLDLESCNLFGHMGCVSYGSGKETFVILTHIDVVPAGDGWDTDPFVACEKDGRIYGRGAVDNKGPAIAALYALYALKESCITLNKRIMLIFGCDEESGWGDIDFYKEHYPEPDYVISPDAYFPIINREKGVLHLEVSADISEGDIVRLTSGSRPNIVPNRAECWISEYNLEHYLGESPVDFKFGKDGELLHVVANGKAAHGSHPERGLNALSHLIALLAKTPITGDGISFLKALNTLIGTGYDGELMGIAGEDDISGALTLNLGAASLADGKASAKLDIRYPLCMDGDALFEKISDKFSEYNIKVQKIHAMAPHFVPEDCELISSLKKVYEAAFGQKATCECCSGATYARAFKNSVAFGPVPKERPSVEHGPNEYIEIDDLFRLVEVIAASILTIGNSKELISI